MQHTCLLQDFSQLGFMANLWPSGLADKWARLPIVNCDQLKHTKQIVSALQHYCAFMVSQSLKQDCDYAKRMVELFKSEVLMPKATKAQKARKVWDAELHDWVGAQLANLPEQSVFKGACKKATDMSLRSGHGMSIVVEALAKATASCAAIA